jgi:hypothetical protein
MAIACQMGKGPYFAHQIRYIKLYLLKNRCLPLPKAYVQGRHHSLLNNEAVLHDVCVYLATQNLGTATPRALCKCNAPSGA